MPRSMWPRTPTLLVLTPALGTLENAWAVPNVGKHTPCPALSALQACPSVFTHQLVCPPPGEEEKTSHSNKQKNRQHRASQTKGCVLRAPSGRS